MSSHGMSPQTASVVSCLQDVGEIGSEGTFHLRRVVALRNHGRMIRWESSVYMSDVVLCDCDQGHTRA